MNWVKWITGRQTFAERLVAEARADWLQPRPVIEYKREIGWRTTHDDDDWCGIWAGAVALRAGLARIIAREVMPSTYRLQSGGEIGWAGAMGAGYKKPAEVPIGAVRKGDIITVKTGKDRAYGDHIAIVYAVLHDKVYTYEGNASGLLPDGSQSSPSRMVVRQVRKMRDVRKVYRFGSGQVQRAIVEANNE